jgi:hypothetical protein
MAASERLICASADLQWGGAFAEIDSTVARSLHSQCVIGLVHAYLNRCGHVPTELDWNEGEFFDMQRVILNLVHTVPCIRPVRAPVSGASAMAGPACRCKSVKFLFDAGRQLTWRMNRPELGTQVLEKVAGRYW